MARGINYPFARVSERLFEAGYAIDVFSAHDTVWRFRDEEIKLPAGLVPSLEIHLLTVAKWSDVKLIADLCAISAENATQSAPEHV